MHNQLTLVIFLVEVPAATRQVDPSSQLGPHDSGQTTVQSLRSQEELRRQATLQLQQLQQLSALTPDTGDSNFLFCKSVKSGRDRMGGDDYRRTYVMAPGCLFHWSRQTQSSI